MRMAWLLASWIAGCGLALAQRPPVERPGGSIDLPTSKQITGVVPGGPQRLGSLPVSIAVSPDGRWVVTTNAGYGSFESGYMQSLAVLNVATGELKDYPDTRTLSEEKQVLFSGLAFSPDGAKLYASMASETDPEGKKAGNTGSGIAVYGFTNGVVTQGAVMKIPLQKLALGRTTKLVGSEPGSLGLPYPAGITIVPTGCNQKTPCDDSITHMLVADNLSDDVLLMTTAGQILRRFDLSENDAVPSVYPVAVVASKDGRRAFVALWNGSEVVELDLVKGTVAGKLPLLKPDSPIAPGSHPDALALSPDGNTLYVALGNRDAVAAIGLAEGKFGLEGFFDTRLPGQSFFGAEPESLALNADGSRLYVANMGSNAVAVLDTHKLNRRSSSRGFVEPIGFIPSEWLPMGVAFTGGKLFIASGKGTGTGPNNFPPKPTELTKNNRRMQSPSTYIPTLLHGSLAIIDVKAAEADLKTLTQETLADNRMKAAEEKIQFDPAVMARLEQKSTSGPIRHVIYIIKENRTYDQIFGDLSAGGAPVGNGDKSLTMYGQSITPNQHALALQFGVMDNFYDSAEVSGDGHVWSNTAIGTDYLERTWQLNYRGRERGYDFEGVVSQGLPLEQRIPDVNEPGSGYIWGNLARHGMTLYHFGEFINSTFCNEKEGAGAELDPTQGPMGPGKACTAGASVKPGARMPAVWGGGVNKWPWAIPLLAASKATKPELVGNFAPEAPDFNLRIPDQVRVDIFLRHLEGWVADKQAGRDTMPNFVMLRLPNDHTAGTTAGGPTPKSSVADNDLAVGRAVEAISHSPFWDDTAFFILEDDAQAGADHVDAHRSTALIVSKYAPHAPAGKPFVDSRFYSTVSMVRTMEMVLGLPPMNNNDALSSAMGSLFTGPGDQPAFVADRTNDTNGLIYQANPKTAAGARESEKMDFRHADRAPTMKLNVILWQDAMGSAPVPPQLTDKRRKIKKDDDD